MALSTDTATSLFSSVREGRSSREAKVLALVSEEREPSRESRERVSLSKGSKSTGGRRCFRARD